MVSDASFPLLPGTHQLYVEFLVPLRRKDEILSHKKGKSVIKLIRVCLGRYLLILRTWLPMYIP